THAFGRTGIEEQGLRLGADMAILDGSDIPIGQVESGRPGKAGAGNDPNLYHPHVTPTAVFLRDGAATANGGNQGIEIRTRDGHGTKVAGAIIGNGPDANAKG